MKRNLPSPDQILEDLADKVALQIDRLARVAFDNALREMTRYHRFLLAVNASRTPEGVAFSYAEVAGDAWDAPHRQWTRQYARLFERGADRIPDDDHFIHSLAHVGGRLLPRPGEPELSAGVLRGIVDLGPSLVHRLEAWVTKRTTTQVERGGFAKPRLILAGSDAKAYANVVTDVVGAWESLLQAAPIVFQWNEERNRVDSERWATFRASWPFLWQHLQNTAYSLVVAVWNEDEIGTALFRDALLGWPETLSHRLDERAELRRVRLLFPDVLNQNWDDALARIRPLLHEFIPAPTPSQLLASALHGAHDDVILITASLLLHWAVNDKQVSDIGGQTAAALLRRERVDPSYERFGEKRKELSFRSLLLDLLRLELSGERYKDQTYGAQLDRFVVNLDNMTERRVVPGRIFTPSTLHSRDELLISFVAILVAAAPAGGDDGLSARVTELAKDETILPQGDRSLREVLSELRRYAEALAKPLSQIRRGFEILKPNGDVEAAMHRVGQIVSSAVSSIEAERLDRLKARPTDAAKMERLRAGMDAAILRQPAEVPFFRNVLTEVAGQDVGERRLMRFSKVPKAQFVEPPMESVMSGLEEQLINGVRRRAGDYVWGDFCRRKREVVAIAAAVEDEAFWRDIGEMVKRVGPEPLLVVSSQAEGRTLRKVIRGADDGAKLKIKRKDRGSTGGSYIATIEDVDVCGADFPRGIAWLFSAAMLRTIKYGEIDDRGETVLLSFELEKEGRMGTMQALFFQESVWADLPIFELHTSDPRDPEDE